MPYLEHSLGWGGVGSYPSAGMQSVYSRDPSDWAELQQEPNWLVITNINDNHFFSLVFNYLKYFPLLFRYLLGKYK